MKDKSWGIVFLVFIVIGSVIHCSKPAAKQEPKVDIQALMQRMSQMYDTHDAAGLSQLFSDDALWLAPSLSVPIQGRDGVRQTFEAVFKAVPDVRIEFGRAFVSGEYGVWEWIVKGTNTGPMTGVLTGPDGEIPPSGRQTEIKGITFLVFTPDGLIKEHKEYHFATNLATQFGLE